MDTRSVLINLLSEQAIPNFIAIRETSPARVIALVTDQFRDQVARLEALSEIPHTPIAIDPFDLPATADALYAAIGDIPQETRLILNFTGGTKAMAVASVLAALRPPVRNLSLLYVNTGKNCCDHYLWGTTGLSSLGSTPFTSSLLFSDVVRLAGEVVMDSVSDFSSIRKRRKLTHWMHKHSGVVGNYYDACFEGSGRRRSVRAAHRLDVQDGRRPVAEIEWRSDTLCVSPTGKASLAFRLANPGAYVAGGWIEEFCLLQMDAANLFDQILGNVRLHLSPETRKLRDQNGRPLGAKNEIDVAVSCDSRTALIECKAGDWGQEHLYKLHAVTKHVCGTFGTPFLVTTFASRYLERDRPEMLEKARDLRIHIVSGDQVDDLASIVHHEIGSQQ